MTEITVTLEMRTRWGSHSGDKYVSMVARQWI